MRGPQLERDRKNLRRVYELIKQGPEQYSFKVLDFLAMALHDIFHFNEQREQTYFCKPTWKITAQGPRSSVPVEFLRWVLEAIMKHNL